MQYFTWNDDEYAQFLVKFLNLLEPRHIEPGLVICNEKEHLTEQFWIKKGNIDVYCKLEPLTTKQAEDEDYDMMLVKSLKHGSIAGVEMTFEIASRFQYKNSASYTDCFSIRKIIGSAWFLTKKTNQTSS